MSQTDPNKFTTKFKKRLEKNLEKAFAKGNKYYSLIDHIEDGWWVSINQKVVSPIIHLLTNHYAYEKECKKYYPKYNHDLQKCARVMAFTREHSDYTDLNVDTKVYWSLPHASTSDMIKFYASLPDKAL